MLQSRIKVETMFRSLDQAIADGRALEAVALATEAREHIRTGGWLPERFRESGDRARLTWSMDRVIRSDGARSNPAGYSTGAAYDARTAMIP